MSYKVTQFVEIIPVMIEWADFPIMRRRPSKRHQPIEDFFDSAHTNYSRMNY